MTTNLTRRIASLAPAVRQLVVRLAAGSDNVTRQVAHAGLSRLTTAERAGLTLGEGKIVVSDLAKEIRSTPRRRIRFLKVTARTSPLARDRADFAKWISGPLWERARLRNRGLIVDAALSILPRDEATRAGWLVYPVEPTDVGIESSAPTFALGPNPEDRGPMHTLYVPRNWRSQVCRIGNGRGFIGPYLILSGRLLAEVAGTERMIHEVVVAYSSTPNMLVTRVAYASSWPNEVRLFGRFGSAYDDRAPTRLSEDLCVGDDLLGSFDKADLKLAA